MINDHLGPLNGAKLTDISVNIVEERTFHGAQDA